MPRARMISFVSHAAVAALVATLGPAAHAALVQITQSGNAVTPFADNLNPDLTGDGIPELTIAGVASFSGGIYQASATIDGQAYTAIGGTTAGGNAAVVSGISNVEAPVGSFAETGYFFNIIFTDPAFGAFDEDGIVEVYIRAEDADQANSGVFIRRLIFDPAQRGTPGFDGKSYPEALPVPEPGVLAMLGLAGLCVARRPRH